MNFERLGIGVLGIAAILLLAFLLSTNRRAIRLRVVGPAFLLQAGIAVLVLYVPVGRRMIEGMAAGVSNLLGYAKAGTDFLFGPLATPEIGGNSFAIAALPVIIFFASLVSILYYLGIMQLIVRWVGGAIERVIGVSNVESLNAAANIFVGQSEAPLVIKPYLAALPPSQIFSVMTVGMAGVAGTILAAYASLLGPGSLPFLLAAAFMSAPGGLLMAKIVMPDVAGQTAQEELPLEDGPSRPAGLANAQDSHVPLPPNQKLKGEDAPTNIIEAAAQGAGTGVKLAVAVGATVLAFVALVALANGILGGIGGWFGYPNLSFQSILGTLFAPVMWLINIPWNEAVRAGGLFGEKIVLNEFVAFISLGGQTDLSPRTVAIITFALCGFANFSSIAIQMAVTGGLAPNQRPTIARLGLRALAAGSLANLMSAALAGLLLPG